jgi:hypothetical protein
MVVTFINANKSSRKFNKNIKEISRYNNIIFEEYDNDTRGAMSFKCCWEKHFISFET